MNGNPQRNLDFKDLLSFIINGKKIILIYLVISSFTSILIIQNLPNIYISSSVVTNAIQTDEASRGGNQLNKLANLAGFGVNNKTFDKSLEAVEILKSYDFFTSNILPYIKFEELMASSHWDASEGKLYLDNEIYHPDQKKWNYNSLFKNGQKPSIQEAFRKFHKDHFSIFRDDKTGFFTINVSHKSPDVAKSWNNLVVSQINKKLRHDDKQRYLKSINFLKMEIAKTEFTELRNILASLLQNEVQKLVLIESLDNYAFIFLSAPYSPDIPSHPKKFIIFIFSLLASLLLGIFHAILKNLTL